MRGDGSRRALVAGLALFGAVAGCGPSAPVAPVATRTTTSGAEAVNPGPVNAQLNALIAAAREEGQLTIVWSGAVYGGEAGLQRITDGLNRRYGLPPSSRSRSARPSSR